jgi:SAM-dependent methyltransferase
MWGTGPYQRITDTLTDIQERIVDRLAPSPDRPWLDLACGTGAVAERAAAAGAPVVGIDLAPALIETARERAAERGLAIDYRVGDCERLDLPDASFDVVLCVHVLEHVPDDAAALRELHRILKPGGWGVIQVPILRETTDEDPSLTDPAERLRRFGQEDHVRIYGRDFAGRLEAAGFELDVQHFRPPPREVARYGLGYDLRRELGYDLDARAEPWEVWRVWSRA